MLRHIMMETMSWPNMHVLVHPCYIACTTTAEHETHMQVSKVAAALVLENR